MFSKVNSCVIMTTSAIILGSIYQKYLQEVRKLFMSTKTTTIHPISEDTSNYVQLNSIQNIIYTRTNNLKVLLNCLRFQSLSQRKLCSDFGFIEIHPGNCIPYTTIFFHFSLYRHHLSKQLPSNFKCFIGFWNLDSFLTMLRINWISQQQHPHYRIAPHTHNNKNRRLIWW